jgi:hypothetical protein
MKTQDTEGWAIPSSPRVPLPFRFGFPSPSVARPVFCRHRSQRRMRVGQKTGWATALNGATETEMQRKCQNSPLKRMGQPPRPVSLTRPPKLSEHSSDSPTHFPEEPKKIGPSGCRGWVWMILETRRNDGTTERRNDGTTERQKPRLPKRNADGRGNCADGRGYFRDPDHWVGIPIGGPQLAILLYRELILK